MFKPQLALSVPCEHIVWKFNNGYEFYLFYEWSGRILELMENCTRGLKPKDSDRYKFYISGGDLLYGEYKYPQGAVKTPLCKYGSKEYEDFINVLKLTKNNIYAALYYYPDRIIKFPKREPHLRWDTDNCDNIPLGGSKYMSDGDIDDLVKYANTTLKELDESLKIILSRSQILISFGDPKFLYCERSKFIYINPNIQEDLFQLKHEIKVFMGCEGDTIQEKYFHFLNEMLK